MREISFSMRAFAAASALFLASTPALAGDEERALAAIAQAQGKIDAAGKLKAGDFDPAVLAKAQASLRLAQEHLKSGKEQAAIRTAVEAQQFADTAIGESRLRADADARCMHRRPWPRNRMPRRPMRAPKPPSAQRLPRQQTPAPPAPPQRCPRPRPPRSPRKP
ncbi:hypothetical protein [Sphingobium fuliginis]|uniref:hypothetical protein n=1 Tax=Sphingobium fuliginis (strain ATCC 27551) TaxID=336203 RepID=UPI0003FECF36|nr:hypothetical protein [Sphingobium fuliginis]